MNNTNPSSLLGGTRTAIVDKFTYCVDPSNGASGSTGGSKKITVAQLPTHSHNASVYVRGRAKGGSEGAEAPYSLSRSGDSTFSFDTGTTCNFDD